MDMQEQMSNYTFIVYNAQGKRIGKIEFDNRNSLPAHKEIARAVKDSFPTGYSYKLEK